MHFFPLNEQYKFLKEDININIKKTLNHGNFILGPEVRKLEYKLKNYTKSKYCITTSSCTDALLMSLMALDVGVGDEVITSAFTYISSIEVICLIGAKPVLIDVKKETANIDYKLLKSKINSRTKAIIVTSLYGNTAEFEEISIIARKNNIKIIEDAAQSFGSEYKGRKSCNIVDVGCTSFFPTKILSAYGDSGAIFTNNSRLAKKFEQIRSHGQSKKYNHKLIGLCGRMDTLQSGIILAKLKFFKKELIQRNQIANKYDKFIKKNFEKKNLFRIEKIEDSISNNYLYTLVTKKRKLLENIFNKNKIPFMIYYSKSIDQQPAYKKYFSSEKFPSSQFLTQNCISIPCHPYLKLKDQNKILNSLLLHISI